MQNEGLKDAVDTTGKSGQITDQTVSASSAQKEESRDAHDAVSSNTDREVEKIHQQAHAEAAKPRAQRPADLKDPEVQPPLTPLTPTEVLDRTVSRVRIQGQWAAYCLNVPSNPKCAKYAQPVAP